MNTWKFMCLASAVGWLYAPQVHAEPLQISPYPAGESVAPAKPVPLNAVPTPPQTDLQPVDQVDVPLAVVPKQDEAVAGDDMIEVVMPEVVQFDDPEVMVVVDEAAPAPPPLPEAESMVVGAPIKIDVPQPGDAYFEPPAAARDIARAAPMPEPEPMPVPQPEPTILADMPDEAGLQSVAAPAAQAPKGNIQMRMSDRFGGSVVESAVGDEVYVAGDTAPPPPFMEERALEPQPVVENIEPQPEVNEAEPERIAWNAAPVPVRSVAPPVEPRGVGLPSAASGDDVWKALEGANIRQVLEKWANEAGVVVLWEDNNAFAVLESFEQSGSFEGAVQRLLDQYKNDQVRPLATLHVDPNTQEKTMVVRVQDGA